MRRTLDHDFDEIAEALEPAEPPARRRSSLREAGLSAPALVVCGYLLLGALVWAGLDSPVRTGLVLALAAVGSGLSLLAVIAPPSADLDGIERAALGAVLSLAVGGLLGVVLARMPTTLNATTLLAGALVFNISCLASVAFRPRDATRLKVRLPGGWWRDQDRGGRLLAVALTLALAGGLWAFGHAASTARSAPPMTEFFIDDPGLVSEPMRRDEPLTVRWGVVNREGTPASYQIRAVVEGREIGQVSGLRLRDGETQTGTIDLSVPEAARPGEAGAARLNLILDRDGRPHRRLQLWIETTQEGATDRGTT